MSFSGGCSGSPTVNPALVLPQPHRPAAGPGLDPVSTVPFTAALRGLCTHTHRRMFQGGVKVVGIGGGGTLFLETYLRKKKKMSLKGRKKAGSPYPAVLGGFWGD